LICEGQLPDQFSAIIDPGVACDHGCRFFTLPGQFFVAGFGRYPSHAMAQPNTVLDVDTLGISAAMFKAVENTLHLLMFNWSLIEIEYYCDRTHRTAELDLKTAKRS
jgi:hypothetical protein